MFITRYSNTINNLGTFNIGSTAILDNLLSGIINNTGTFNATDGRTILINNGIINNSCDGIVNVTIPINGNPVVQLSCDTEPPTIILLGDNPQEILINEPYIELGATITDNSGEVIIPTIDASLVDIATSGDYLVSYNAEDSTGNIAITVFRTVTVLSQDEAIDNLTEELENAITSGDLGSNTGGLLAKLDQIMNKLDSGNVNSACNQLNAFINQLDGIISNGTPEEIAAAQIVLDAANGIQSSYC